MGRKTHKKSAKASHKARRAATPGRNRMRGKGDYEILPGSKLVIPGLPSRDKLYKLPGTNKTLGGALGALMGAPFGLSSLGEKAGDMGHSLFKRIFGFGSYDFTTRNEELNTLVRDKGRSGVSALIAGNLPQFGMSSAGGGSVTFTMDEWLGTLESSADFAVQSYNINMGLRRLFKWGANQAKGYTQYKIHQMVFGFESTSGASMTSPALGTIVMATHYDPNDKPFRNMAEAVGYYYRTVGNPTQHMAHGVELAKDQTSAAPKYVRIGDVPDYMLRDDDYGILNVVTQGMPAAGYELGRLWVSYRVSFFKPTMENLMLGAFWRGNSSYTSALPIQPLGNLVALPGSNMDVVAGGFGSLQLAKDAGTYVVQITCMSTSPMSGAVTLQALGPDSTACNYYDSGSRSSYSCGSMAAAGGIYTTMATVAFTYSGATPGPVEDIVFQFPESPAYQDIVVDIHVYTVPDGSQDAVGAAMTMEVMQRQLQELMSARALPLSVGAAASSSRPAVAPYAEQDSEDGEDEPSARLASAAKRAFSTSARAQDERTPLWEQTTPPIYGMVVAQHLQAERDMLTYMDAEDGRVGAIQEAHLEAEREVWRALRQANPELPPSPPEPRSAYSSDTSWTKLEEDTAVGAGGTASTALAGADKDQRGRTSGPPAPTPTLGLTARFRVAAAAGAKAVFSPPGDPH